MRLGVCHSLLGAYMAQNIDVALEGDYIHVFNGLYIINDT